VAAGLVSLHPVHVEAVASLVGRASCWGGGYPGPRWRAAPAVVVAVLCAALAMFSKEHGVTAGVSYCWIGAAGSDERPYPRGFWIALAVVTTGFVAVWFAVGWVGESDEAVFYDRGTWGRLAIALPALLRAALLLICRRSSRSITTRRCFPLVPASRWRRCWDSWSWWTPTLALWCRRAHRDLVAAGLAALSCLPTANCSSVGIF